MKMSDVFDLPFTADAEFQSIHDASGEPLPDFESVEKDKAVVQAINSHDALVALNKELSEALSRALDSAQDEYSCGQDFVDEMTDLINKAKELTNE